MGRFLQDQWPFTTKRSMNAAIDKVMDQAKDDYQHTHDSLWRILEVLCDEFDLKLTIQPREDA